MPIAGKPEKFIKTSHFGPSAEITLISKYKEVWSAYCL